MTADEIRQQFIDFFVQHGHRHRPADSLIPKSDRSVLFTTAGMQQFKPYFTQPAAAPDKRLTTAQPCLRTSDLSQVGDETHLTFFEMLGNFSFGYKTQTGADRTPTMAEKTPINAATARAREPYFKEVAIRLAWQLMTEVYKIANDRLTVTVFRGDQTVPLDSQSIRIWQSIGLPADRIALSDRQDNFWGPTGNEGPCGPTTEILVDGLEVWNLVFNEYYQDQHGRLTKLKFQGVDTGMGLERLTQILQKKKTVFETDLFQPILGAIARRRPSREMVTDADRSVRIISDHLRAMVFLVSDGLVPSNKDRGYVLRRLIRRAITHGRLIELPVEFLVRSAELVVKKMSSAYPSLAKRRAELALVIGGEERRFIKTLDAGWRELRRIESQAAGYTIDGQAAFRLQESFGLPIELASEIAEHDGYAIQMAEFEAALKDHQARSRQSAQKKFSHQ